jgi:signal transduction histidine kinase
VTVSADRVRLGQVLANLLGNALKFTPEGGRIELVVAEADGEARVEVADTGPGIAPGDRARVLDRFWRGEAAAGVGGRGIGLAVVDEIVRAHGGRVDVSENDGGGARFIVALPAG